MSHAPAPRPAGPDLIHTVTKDRARAARQLPTARALTVGGLVVGVLAAIAAVIWSPVLWILAGIGILVAIVLGLRWRSAATVLAAADEDLILVQVRRSGLRLPYEIGLSWDQVAGVDYVWTGRQAANTRQIGGAGKASAAATQSALASRDLDNAKRALHVLVTDYAEVEAQLTPPQQAWLHPPSAGKPGNVWAELSSDIGDDDFGALLAVLEREVGTRGKTFAQVDPAL